MHLLWNHPDAPFPCGTSLNHPDHIAGVLTSILGLTLDDVAALVDEGVCR